MHSDAVGVRDVDVQIILIINVATERNVCMKAGVVARKAYACDSLRLVQRFRCEVEVKMHRSCRDGLDSCIG